MTQILAALRSPGMMLLALVLALFAQGEHTAQVFASFSHPTNGPQLLAYAFAGAVEVAVLLFVMNGHKTISYIFAGATFATNLVYYAIGGIDLLSVQLAPVLLLSALLPGVIVGYSHTIAATGATETRAATQPRALRWQFWRKPATPATLHDNTPPAEHSTETPDEIGDIIPATSAAQPEAQRSSADIARELGVSRQTVDGWKRRGTLTMNIARRLPTVAAPTTNGNGGTHE